MAQQTDQLTATKRTETGKRRMRRLRASGSIPAVIYGHGQESVSIAVPSDQFGAALRHGSRLVELTGDLKESALIDSVQWDAFGNDPLHIDFIRVDKDEKVDITVTLELRGDAPGSHDGGVISQPLHQLEINCPVTSIPESIEVNINSLDLEGEITAGELELPEGAVLITPADQTVVQCVVPTAVEEEVEAAAGESAEPEVIGRDKEEEGSDES